MPSIFQTVLIRTAVSLALAYGVAKLFPSVSDTPMYAVAAVAPVMLLAAVVFLRALKRHEDLSESVSLELNKLRRVYHLGKNLAGDDSKLRTWFTDLHGFLYGYLTGFDKKEFSRYQETNGDFRKLSYHLYTLPDVSSEKDRVLYRELLEAAGVVAGSRQRIQELWNGGLSSKVWNVMYAIAALAGAAILVSISSDDWLAAGLLLSVMASAVALVKSVDQMRTVSGEALSKRYVENLARLELKRR